MQESGYSRIQDREARHRRHRYRSFPVFTGKQDVFVCDPPAALGRNRRTTDSHVDNRPPYRSTLYRCNEGKLLVGICDLDNFYLGYRGWWSTESWNAAVFWGSGSASSAIPVTTGKAATRTPVTARVYGVSCRWPHKVCRFRCCSYLLTSTVDLVSA